MAVPAKFSALSFAILRAWERLPSDEMWAAPAAILRAPEINQAVDVLPAKFREEFREWFTGLSLAELEGMRADSKAEGESINSLGARLFAPDEAKAKGAIFTPDWLAYRITYEAIRHWRRLNPGKGEPSLAGDLSCGPGAFLAQLRNLLPKDTTIVGTDSCPEYVCLARLNAVGRRPCVIESLDTLTDLRQVQTDLFDETLGVPAEGYDLIVGNPPYIRSQLLNAAYARTLKGLYPEFTAGNFDLVVLFLAHTLGALAPGGIGSLVVSNKFMVSRYGSEICKHLATSSRILEIMDFGDGQVFPDKTTYICAITFAKLPPTSPTTLIKFPPGLKWNERGEHLELGQKTQIPLERLQSVPWNLAGESHDEILRLMHRPQHPRLIDVFPNISQGVRTGANHVFVIRGSAVEEIEPELLHPYATGENIRRCRIVPSNRHLLWLYRSGEQAGVTLLRPDELEKNYPGAWAYLQRHRQELSERDLEAGTPWYGYSRSQNLELQHRPKILAREMMPWAEFAADTEGRYNLCSGYAFVAPADMSADDLQLWAAVLSTPTMEFQLRLTATQLHSGWVRVLKHHLKRVRLPSFTKAAHGEALLLAQALNEHPFDAEKWDEMDGLVAKAFGLSEEMRGQIRQHLDIFHAISNPERRDQDVVGATADGKMAAALNEDADGDEHHRRAVELTPEQLRQYMPVELPQYYPLHRNRENLRSLVTFNNNKSAPIHRWYKYTQGYSGELVKHLIDELGVQPGAVIYDPFAGSGTTLLSCRQIGIASFGAEISPFMEWVARLKVYPWSTGELRRVIETVGRARPEPEPAKGLLFHDFFEQAYAPEILKQVMGWRGWIMQQKLGQHLRDFLLLGLVSILEDVSQIRKHGSHYRFLNKIEHIGIGRLNITTIDSSSDLKPILLEKLELMRSDVEAAPFKQPLASCETYCLDATVTIPPGRHADFVITSPPYLNRNNYIAQQKAEMGILRLLSTYKDYRALVRSSFRSHVESNLQKEAISAIPEVQTIVEAIKLTENNNAKIPHMVCGYFDDLRNTLETLREAVNPGGKLAFVVGNSRWGGVVVPVDHLLALIAERLDYNVERIFVTRLKGNSPQQMRRYGRIPMRESIVVLRR